MVSKHPEPSLADASPALAMLILALGGAIVGKALPRRPRLARLVRREPPTSPAR